MSYKQYRERQAALPADQQANLSPEQYENVCRGTGRTAAMLQRVRLLRLETPFAPVVVFAADTRGAEEQARMYVRLFGADRSVHFVRFTEANAQEWSRFAAVYDHHAVYARAQKLRESIAIQQAELAKWENM